MQKMPLGVRTDDVSTPPDRLGANVTPDMNRTQTSVKVLCSLLEDSVFTVSFPLGELLVCLYINDTGTEGHLYKNLP